MWVKQTTLKEDIKNTLENLFESANQIRFFMQL